MGQRSRRTFMGLTLSAAGASLMPRAASAAGTTVPTLEIVYLVVFRPGESWLAGKPLEAQNLREHGRYMLALHREGILRFAGRFADGSGGAAVFAATDDAAATLVVQKDPAVVAKVFDYDLRRWMRVDWEKLSRPTDG
jgi:uncharacterized protein YciI